MRESDGTIYGFDPRQKENNKHTLAQPGMRLVRLADVEAVKRTLVAPDQLTRDLLAEPEETAPEEELPPITTRTTPLDHMTDDELSRYLDGRFGVLYDDDDRPTRGALIQLLTDMEAGAHEEPTPHRPAELERAPEPPAMPPAGLTVTAPPVPEHLEEMTKDELRLYAAEHFDGHEFPVRATKREMLGTIATLEAGPTAGDAEPEE